MEFPPTTPASAGPVPSGGPGEFPQSAPARTGPRLPACDWPWWTAPAAVAWAVVLLAVGSFVVAVVAALLFGVSLASAHPPGGVEIAGTVVQDALFVAAAVLAARTGGRAVRAWQFGLQRPGIGWLSPRKGRLWAAGMAVLTLVAFLVFTAAWAEMVNVNVKDNLPERLGAGEGTGLLLLTAVLICVVAPICEEFLFRGLIFRALCNWRGVWPAAAITGLLFGAVHAGSAPVVDLVPLAALGFALCVLYRATGSLYPCIAVHALNNSLAFGALEKWGWWTVVLMAAAPAAIALLVVVLKRRGVITPPPDASDADAQEARQIPEPDAVDDQGDQGVHAMDDPFGV
jgi:membrane protease YdiL (CAAX protease family)